MYVNVCFFLYIGNDWAAGMYVIGYVGVMIGWREI